MNTNQWWGYKHTSGTYQAKRYFGPLDIQEAKESPFCAQVVGPFDAVDRNEALHKVEMLCRVREEPISNNKDQDDDDQDDALLTAGLSLLGDDIPDGDSSDSSSSSDDSSFGGFEGGESGGGGAGGEF